MFRQYRHQSHNQRHFAVDDTLIVFLEREFDAQRRYFFGKGDLLVISTVIGSAFVAQRLERKQNIVGGNRRAVGKMAALFRLKMMLERSSGTSTLSAINAYSVNGSPHPRVIRLS